MAGGGPVIKQSLLILGTHKLGNGQKRIDAVIDGDRVSDVYDSPKKGERLFLPYVKTAGSENTSVFVADGAELRDFDLVLNGTSHLKTEADPKNPAETYGGSYQVYIGNNVKIGRLVIGTAAQDDLVTIGDNVSAVSIDIETGPGNDRVALGQNIRVTGEDKALSIFSLRKGHREDVTEAFTGIEHGPFHVEGGEGIDSLEYISKQPSKLTSSGVEEFGKKTTWGEREEKVKAEKKK